MSAVKTKGGPRSTSRSPVRLIMAVTAAVLAVGAAIYSAVILWIPNPSAIERLAAEATPEVAALLREADAVTRKLVEDFPGDAYAMHVVAWLHSRCGKSQEAASFWKKCLEFDPSFTQAHLSLGLTAESEGDHRLAAEYFSKASALDPSAPAYPVYQAKALKDLGEGQEAAAVLEKAERRRPHSVPVLVLLGEIYLQLGEPAKAKNKFATAIKLTPELASPYYGLATACTRLGDSEAAKGYLEKFKELKARDEQTHRNELKKPDNLATLRTDVAGVFTEAGKVYLAHGDGAQGEECLSKAVALDKKHVGANLAQAWWREQQGRAEEAHTILARLAEAVPDELSVQVGLGELSMKLGRLEDAEAAYRRAIALAPQEAGGYAALAQLHLKKGTQLDEALQFARSAYELEPLPEYCLLSSIIYGQKGDFAAALQALDRAIELDPRNQDYPRMRAGLQAQAFQRRPSD